MKTRRFITFFLCICLICGNLFASELCLKLSRLTYEMDIKTVESVLNRAVQARLVFFANNERYTADYIELKGKNDFVALIFRGDQLFALVPRSASSPSYAAWPYTNLIGCIEHTSTQFQNPSECFESVIRDLGSKRIDPRNYDFNKVDEYSRKTQAGWTEKVGAYTAVVLLSPIVIVALTFAILDATSKEKDTRPQFPDPVAGENFDLSRIEVNPMSYDKYYSSEKNVTFPCHYTKNKRFAFGVKEGVIDWVYNCKAKDVFNFSSDVCGTRESK